MHLADEAESRAQSLEMKEDSWRESSREKPDKASASLDSAQWCCVTDAEYARKLNKGGMRSASLLSVVCDDEGTQRNQQKLAEKSRRGRRASGKVWLRFFRSRSTGVCLSHCTWFPALIHRGQWPPSKHWNVYAWSASTHVGSSTNARFIESLDSKYKSVVDRVQDSRRDNSDDEDEDALFAELEAELENVDSASLRDKGLKEMQAQLSLF